jgi:NodT family efflux transporter outer membrane factor (OMF) lipoprotein
MTARLAAMALARVCAAVLLLAGCAVGPDFHEPAAPAITSLTPEPLPAATAAAPGPAGSPQTFTQGLDIPGQWWTLYRSPALNALIARALEANPDLQSAQAALRAARETYYAQRGALLPTVDVGYNITREQAPATVAPPLSSNVDLYTLHTAQVTVGYTLDVFGAVRRQTEATRAQAESQRYQTEAAYLTLTSNLVAAAIGEASLRDQIDATKAIIGANEQVLAIMRRQLSQGGVSGADVAAQETLVAQARQTLPPLEKQWAQQRDLIADLTGQYPGQSSAETLDFSSLALPTDMPVSLPSAIVAQRPDIRAASANLHAASAELGVAIANRLPNITLAATAGGASTSLSDLFTHGNGFWSLAGDVAQPVFEGGALLHRQRAAKAALDQARAQYRGAVLSAFQNVADSLQALDADARSLSAAAAAERTAGQSLRIAKTQQSLGQSDLIVVLTAEQAYRQAVIAHLQAQTARYLDTAALFESLGGGWWNRAETSGKL